MRLYPIIAGNYKIDGGAMFGVVPKTLWSKKIEADLNNRIDITMRSLLIEDGKRLILIDCGMGDKQDKKFFSHYEPWGDTIQESLLKFGFTTDDITDVFLTHLHFDHCGGAVKRDSKGNFIPTFKNAIYWSNEEHWKWAVYPNPREKASFLKENILPIQESGQLNFISTPIDGYFKESPMGFDILFVDGHTEKQMLPIINVDNQIIVYVADLIPTVYHIPLPYIPSYDIQPLVSLKEKQKLLENAAHLNYILFFEHDLMCETAKVEQTEKGIQIKETANLTEYLGAAYNNY